MTHTLIADPDDARLAPYRAVGDAVLLRDYGLFAAEGRFVVERLLRESDYKPHSVLVSPASARALESLLTEHAPELPIHVCPPDLLQRITGFDFHRGCLALAHRPSPTESRARIEACLSQARLVVALDGVSNADNVGAIIRNAEAFGASAAVLSPTSCDPLYRRAIRVSMGAVLRMPVAKWHDWPAVFEQLKAAGFRLVALMPGGDTTLADAPLDDQPTIIVVGGEGPGVSAAVAQLADYRVRIPLAPHVDSLNVSTASGIALHWWTQRRSRDTLATGAGKMCRVPV